MNFEFLRRYWPALADIGAAAESYLYSDPNSCIYKLGMFGERLVAEIFSIERLPTPDTDDTQATRIRILKRERLLPQNIDDILYILRKRRNDAVHGGLDSLSDAKTLLESAHRLSVWFMEVYGDWGYIADPFVMPEQKPDIDYASIISDLEGKIQQLTSEVTAAQTAAATATRKERQTQAEKVSKSKGPTEAETRLVIDCQLRDAGWEADTSNLRYSKGTRPTKGHNIAIAEWPTDSIVEGKGSVDYALFAGLELVGILEAKKIDVDVAAVIDNQCVKYGKGIRAIDAPFCIGEWDGFKVPFLFASNSRKYFPQWPSKSGVWFRDVRDGSTARPLRGFYSPEGLKQLLISDSSASNKTLENTPIDILRDPDGLALRPYQEKAVMKVEQAIISGKKTALLSMATGTGKTRVIIGIIYRLLKSGRFNRVLFLVDRNALGDQAEKDFDNLRIERLMPLNDLFIISHLNQKGFDLSTQIKVATVQSMMKHVMGDGTGASVDEYDLIIVDEAHRGYLLDKELSETEVLYRNEAEYLSKYKMVIDYFDAVKIGLTATPALHTVEIFGHSVFNYTYTEAVTDGWLCDHNPPHNIMSALRQEGITYKKGEHLTKLNPITGELINGEELEDDLKFDVESFNRKIVNSSFNETLMEEVAKSIDPEGDGKTLIFAVSDEHADELVRILREIYSRRGIAPEYIRKITGSIGDAEVIKTAIREFKNERKPNIVVTVDLLTTGIDVPQITSLVFMRLVRSRILFEQMMGRATRKCDEIGKEAFDVFDCVGVFDVIGDFNSMKSVTPKESFQELIKGLAAMEEKDHIRAQINRILAKMRRRMKFFTKDAQEQFEDLTGGYSIRAFADALQALNEEDKPSEIEPQYTAAQAFTVRNLPAFKMLDADRRLYDGKYVDFRPDHIVSHTQGYGNNQKPEDYLESFGEFIKTHINEIDALHILVTRPSDLTRDALKSLRLELNRHQFTERQLNSAWKAVTNQEITADIIAFIRQQALGSELISHESRIKHAFARLRQSHSFDKSQENWLKKIESTMLQEPVLDEELFNQGAFRANGGFNVIDRRFDGRLRELIQELNSYIYDDVGA